MGAVLAIAVLFAVITIVVVVLSARHDRKISSSGIETVGEIIFVYTEYDQTGKEIFVPYVSFTDRDGEQHDARLNARKNFPTGTLVRIKYLPGDCKMVNFIDLLDE